MELLQLLPQAHSACLCHLDIEDRCSSAVAHRWDLSAKQWCGGLCADGIWSPVSSAESGVWHWRCSWCPSCPRVAPELFVHRRFGFPKTHHKQLTLNWSWLTLFGVMMPERKSLAVTLLTQLFGGAPALTGFYKSRQVTAFVRTRVWPRASLLAQSSCRKGSPCLGWGWHQPSLALPCASWAPAERLSFMPAVIDCQLFWSRALVPAVAESFFLFSNPLFLHPPAS